MFETTQVKEQDTQDTAERSFKKDRQCSTKDRFWRYSSCQEISGRLKPCGNKHCSNDRSSHYHR